MGYVTIKDFQRGLDVRKDKLSMPAGTLTKLINGHITPGGEIEKRKAFTKATGYGATSLPPNTFGMQETATGILVFGSGDYAGLTYPAGFSYQRLQHPAVLAGTTYSAGSHAMTAVIHSACYGSYAFVCAQFADGYQFAYYNGALVNDFVAGLVLPYLNTNPKIAAHLAGLVNNTVQYTAVQDASPNDHKVDVFSLPGNEYSAAIAITHTSNVAVETNTDTSYTTAIVRSVDGANPADGKKVTIGGKLYQFKNTIGTTEGNVKIGDTARATLLNLYNAINHTGTPNTDYYCAAINATVAAQNYVGVGNPYFTVQARTQNANNQVANSIPAASYSFDNPTVLKLLANQAEGQFKITALNPSVFATATVSQDGGTSSGAANNVSAGASIAINGTVYTFGPAAIAYRVKVGATFDATMDSLIKAINGTGVVGTDVGATTPANTFVTAGARTGTGTTATFTLTAILPGSAANAYTLVQNGTTHFLGATFSNGVSSGVTSIKVGPVFASGSFTTNNSNPANAETITIGATVYTFKTALTSTDGEILIGASAQATLLNLIAAINQTGVQSVDYFATSLNPQVSALATLNNGVLQLIARTAGSAANTTIAISTTSSTLTASGATLAGGADTVELLSASVISLTTDTKSKFAKTLLAGINAYSATSGYKATLSEDTIYLKSVQSNSFSNNAAVQVTTTGQIAISFCAFSLNASKAGGQSAITKLEVDGTDISGIVAWPGTTVSALATALALAVNTGASAATYTALAQGNVVYLSRVVNRSDDLQSTVTCTPATPANLGIAEVGNAGITAVVSPTYITIAAGNGYAVSSLVSTCKAAGGYPPYTYRWQFDSGDSAFAAVNPTSPNTNFSRTDSGGAQNGKMACKVTDSRGNSATSNTVSLYQQ